MGVKTTLSTSIFAGSVTGAWFPGWGLVDPEGILVSSLSSIVSECTRAHGIVSAMEPQRRGHGLVHFDAFDNFAEAKQVSAASITPELTRAVRLLDEREEFEPFIRSILSDSTETAHGPAEIADILTLKLTLDRETGIAAFVLKGKSFSTVRPKHVSHQIYRLEKIAGLRFAVFAASGHVLDSTKEEFCSTAQRLSCKYAVLDAIDLARLFVAFGFLCPRDARRIAAGRCGCGYSPEKRVLNILQVDSLSITT